MGLYTHSFWGEDENIWRLPNFAFDSPSKNVPSHRDWVQTWQLRPIRFEKARSFFPSTFNQFSPYQILASLELQAKRVSYRSNVWWCQLNEVCGVVYSSNIPVLYCLVQFQHLRRGLRIFLILFRYPDIIPPVTIECLILLLFFKRTTTWVGGDRDSGAEFQFVIYSRIFTGDLEVSYGGNVITWLTNDHMFRHMYPGISCFDYQDVEWTVKYNLYYSFCKHA